MTYYDRLGQGLLPLGKIACDACPYGSQERCAGPSTPDSLLHQSDWIGCLDAGKQAVFYENLHRRIPSESKAQQKLPRLPRFIPALKEGLPAAAWFPAHMLVGVSLGALIDDSGRLLDQTQSDLRHRLHLQEQARLCLINSVDDKRLEAFWKKSEKNDSWYHIRRLAFEFVTTTTCSVWEEVQPRFDQIYNQERNLASYDFLTQVDYMKVIPFVFAARPEDYTATARWLLTRNVRVVAVLGQFYRDSMSFRQLTTHMTCLQKSMPYPLRFVVVGCATSRKIEEVFTRFRDAVIVSSQPVFKGIFGHSTDDDLTYRFSERRARGELVMENVEKYRLFCDRVHAKLSRN